MKLNIHCICNENYQPFDFGADMCCNAVRKCADKRHGKLSECVPEYSGGGYFKNGDETTGRYRSWLCVSSQKYGNCDEFYQWCGM
uniref:Uncharacterized protein n=1 Tax=Meloidogyne enterolobii TaxID=390850 RepID=A0A6V7TUK7_MELEN|nr:unnamed protein product [Meloidogyne enterolobii]